MKAALLSVVARELDVAVPPEISDIAQRLADEAGRVAVLYYGSTLRTGDLDGVLDFYVLIDRARGSLPRRIGMRWLWPDVGYREFVVGGRTIRAKIATMPLATFEHAARGGLLDTTIWTRFVQPAALVWQVDPSTARRVVGAVAEAIVTAARFAAVVGPIAGQARDFWLALFRETYRAELRVEPSGREATILSHDPARYERLLPLAWRAGGIGHAADSDTLVPAVPPEMRRRALRAWRLRTRTGRPLNAARLIKAAFTFDGAARYGLWKVQRHTGVVVELTPWRERHPILASLPVLWQVVQRRAS